MNLSGPGEWNQDLDSSVNQAVNPVNVIQKHGNDITCLDFTGKNLLATSSSDKTVRVYKWQVDNTFTEMPYSPLRGHTYGVNCVMFSPYGSKLASSSTDGLTIIWDCKTGERLACLQSSGAAVRVCAFSNNSTLVATGGDDDVAVLWDISALALIREFGSHESTVTSMCFTPDSSYLATGCTHGEIRVWDARYGHSVPLAVKVGAHDLGVSSVHFNPSVGKDDNSSCSNHYYLASGGQDTVLHLWLIKVGNPHLDNLCLIQHHRSLRGHESSIMCVKFSNNGLWLASASGDKTVIVWDSVHLKAMAKLENHDRYVTSCAFSEDDSLLATGGGDRRVCIWQVDALLQYKLSSKLQKGASLRSKMMMMPQQFRENKKLIDWSSSDVCSWLTEHGLAEYSSNFRYHAIDGREMLGLTDEILEKKLGVDALGHRSRILRLIGKFSKLDEPDSQIPKEFICPITQEIINEPVLCADGFTYERVAMECWLASGKRTSPMTNAKLLHTNLTPNHTVRTLIEKYKQDHS